MSEAVRLPIEFDGHVLAEGDVVALPARGGFAGQKHVFEQNAVDAANCALAAGRPLLVRGEPGTGKSQLAHALAAVLHWRIRCKVVDARSEPRDLLYEFDVVERLGAAQTLGAARMSADEIRQELHPAKFTRPGPLWWAFEWQTAADQVGDKSPVPEGCVVLIDEIDKGDADVPNGLLQALGDGEFPVPGREQPIRAGALPRLVVVTTNEEKTLPAPFVRRCVVLHLDLPVDAAQLIECLSARAQQHFPGIAGEVRLRAASLLVEQRAAAKQQGLPRPGQAEYLDLLRAVTVHARHKQMSAKQQVELVERLGRFTYDKHPRPDLA